MNNLLSRLAMAFLLAASCFLVTGCGDAETPDKTPAAETDADTAAAEGSAAKEGSDSK